ncbi:MAG: Fe-S cluster assembly ATPase SufC [Candidatus Tectomicrobia bacterium]|uniref:Fe-S cluster assembly ATPase SufC n=1 Tax=Tectimicrobiota bacterium TaxID=2528274 RepID=A0A932CMC1_UNCTE|nr:Fe-S cluster assembly ATPase SufC [Candidatus Tectomicrobia bacterium]
MTRENPVLSIEELQVSVEGKRILKGLSLEIRPGEIHALMGPNGSGKSTLAFTLMGHPNYQVDGGRVLFQGEDLLALKPDERARRGLFLAFQYPSAIPGVSVANFLRLALKAVRGAEGNGKPLPSAQFRKLLRETMGRLKMEPDFATRHLNEGFSGGEKKRLEILQLSMLQPALAILDEIDSGLDIDALKTVSEGVNHLAGTNLAMLIITHYQRILNYIQPHVVHVLMDGRVALSGGSDLARQLEAQGYEGLRGAESARQKAQSGVAL